MISDWKLNSQIQNYKKGRTDIAEKKYLDLGTARVKR